MTSKLIDGSWLTECEKKKEILPGLLFMETTPPRWMSSIPFVNFYYTSEYFDNYWVKLERMPDGKTYVGKTDT